MEKLEVFTSCNLPGNEKTESLGLSSTLIRLQGVNRPGEEAGIKIRSVTTVGKASTGVPMRMGLQEP